MTEKSSDELAAIYRMDESVKTIKVVLQKGAEGDYLISYEVIDNGDGAPADTVVFNNETIPEVPGNPDIPDNPGTPNDSADSKASGDEDVLSETGDVAPIAPLVAPAIGGLGLAILCVRRVRKD